MFRFSLFLALFLCEAVPAVTITGTLASSDDVFLYAFQLSTPSTLSVQTYQFGGGAGFIEGGIDSLIAIFQGNDPNAVLVAYNDDGLCPPGNANPYCGDSTLTLVDLAAGEYYLAITVSPNQPVGPTLGAGFTGGGALPGNFTYAVLLDATPTLTPVPEPGTAALGALALLWFAKRRWFTALARATCLAAPLAAADIQVPAGSSLQNAIDNASLGDTLILQPGAVYQGNFMGRNKTGSGWLTIRVNSPVYGRPGVRVTPADTAQLAVLQSPNDLPVLDFAPGAHHYRLIGLELRPGPGYYPNDVVRLGNATETTLAELPHDVELDRCYLHGDPLVGGKRGISLNGAAIAVLNSTLSGFFSTWQETQAIAGWNGPGPYRIVNNYLEASGISILFGGGRAWITGVLPSDIEIRRNHFFKPLSWKPSDPAYGGVLYITKLHLEFKFGRRAIIDGNVFENSWYPPDAGRSIAIGVYTQGGTVPWAVSEDIQITSNIFRNLGAGLLIYGGDPDFNYTIGATRRVRVENNLFIDVREASSQAGFNNAGVMANIHSGAEQVHVRHNTYVGDGQNAVYHVNTLGAGYRFENNLIQHNRQGISWFETLFNLAALNQAAPLGYTFAGNAIQGGQAANFPAGNFFPATLDDIGYANLTLRDLRLRPSSPYARAGTDGKDIGADAAAVYQATQGVVTGTAGRCVTGLTPGSASFNAAGGGGTLTVSAPASCFWMTTLPLPSWLTVTAGYSGQGGGPVTFTVAPLPTGVNSRAASVLVGGLKAVVQQTR